MCYNLYMCKRTQFSREGTDGLLASAFEVAFAGCGVREMRMGTDGLLASAFEENYVSETSTEKPEDRNGNCTIRSRRADCPEE